MDGTARGCWDLLPTVPSTPRPLIGVGDYPVTATTGWELPGRANTGGFIATSPASGLTRCLRVKHDQGKQRDTYSYCNLPALAFHCTLPLPGQVERFQDFFYLLLQLPHEMSVREENLGCRSTHGLLQPPPT